jgi:hypothetical protein
VITSYTKGSVVRIDGPFTDEASAVADPAAVLFRFRKPSGAETTYVYGTDTQLVKDSVGNYHADIDADLEGLYYYRMWSTGTGKAAAEGEFFVQPSGVS